MGRYRYSDKLTVEQCTQISTTGIKHLINNPLMRITTRCLVANLTICLIYSMKSGRMLISYIDTAGHEMTAEINIIEKEANIPGVIYYFACPNCDSRVFKLYKPCSKINFACRRCHDLTYNSRKRHLKSRDKFKAFKYLGTANRLKIEGKNKTATGRKRIQHLENKATELFARHKAAIWSEIGNKTGYNK